MSLAHTREGTLSLTDPFSQIRTSKDLNRGLYPTYRAKKRKSDAEFYASQSCITDFFKKTGFCRQQVTKMDEGGGTKAVIEPSCQLDESMDDDMFFSEEDLEEISYIENLETATFSKRRSSPQASCSRELEQTTWDRFSKKPCFVDNSQMSYRGKNDPERGELLTVDPVFNIYYGLVENSVPYAEPQGHIEHLPDELLRCIFSYLPAEDLYLRISLVCHRWRSIVHDPLFVPWKKMYYRYMKMEEEAELEVEQILLESSITVDEDLCVVNLVKYLASFRLRHSTDMEAVLCCLKHHHLYVMAEETTNRRWPELMKTAKNVNVMSVVAVIVLLSETVRDIQSLISCLSNPRSSLTLSDVTEMMYCMTTLVFAMRENCVDISNRIHYNLFHSLYLLENSSVTQICEEKVPCWSYQRLHSRGPVSIHPTHEQQLIINHEIAPGQVVKIMAFAGTGKTSTLIKYAEKRPHLKFLYVAFNKSVKMLASQTFPSNVECSTVHSMALARVGQRYKERKKINWSGLKPFIINEVLPEKRGGYVRAKQVTQILNTFFASTDSIITTEHAPVRSKNTHGEMVLVDPEEKLKLVKDAQQIWDRMQSLDFTDKMGYYITHDGYLKLWQLSRPYLPYDVIFIDEAQDCTPASMDIVLSQNCGKILVGDPCQQIYSFRGAVNALNEVPHTHIYYLTQSFRFGPEIAYVGATVLDAGKKMRRKILVGGNQKGCFGGNTAGTLAVLCRTNAAVFDEAVKVTEGLTPSRIHIVGGVENFGLSKIRDLWKLLQPEKERERHNLIIEDKFLRSFIRRGGYGALKDYVTKAEDKEWEVKMAIVEKYNIRIPELVERIYSHSVTERAHADVILSTVHKAKGLEFDTVKLTDDFLKIPCAKHNLWRIPELKLESIPEDEWNLLYVAVTRAKKCLLPTKSLEYILTLAGEYLLRPELTSKLFTEGQLPGCSVAACANSVVEDSILTFCKIPLTYSDKREDVGGPLCLSCVEQRIGPMTYLGTSPETVKTMPYTEENVVLPMNMLMLHALF
ncbi:F-box DNA helicase 1 isoform X2 [Protopterus annectens]|nr:F-box DNA helicase 1 isoform X2 [Protopterus annectens]